MGIERLLVIVILVVLVVWRAHGLRKASHPMNTEIQLIVNALRRSADTEEFYAKHGDGKGTPINDAIHMALASALERIADDIEHASVPVLEG